MMAVGRRPAPAPQAAVTGLLARLPAVAGRLQPGAPLGENLWFRAGGPAEVLFRPKDADDLARFLAGCPADVPLTVIGVGSNLLVRDGGVPGVVIRLGGGFAAIGVDGHRIAAGAGALDLAVAETAVAAGLGGLEFLSGIPGTIGGALRMNAGAYGGEIKDVLVEATALDRAGRLHRVGVAELGFGYRHASAPADWIFTGAVLQGRTADIAHVQLRMAEIRQSREATQPVRARTGGSTFKNPPGHRAWELIDRAGCRGLREGGAVMSDKHCNFLINEGGATASDIETLGERVRARVLADSGVTLEWEIRRIGVPADDPHALVSTLAPAPPRGDA